MKSFLVGLTLILFCATAIAPHAQAQAQASRPLPPAEIPPPVETPKPVDTPESPGFKPAQPAPPPAETPAPAQTAAPPPIETPAAPPVPAPQPTKPRTKQGWPFVTIQVGNPRALLQSTEASWRRVKATGTSENEGTPLPDVRWETVCRAPCEERVDPTLVYRVGGRGLVASDPFQLSSADRRVELKGRIGSKASRIGGGIVGGIGLANLMLNGLVLLASDPSTDANGNKQGPDRGLLTVGVVIGGLLAVVGIGMLLSNGTSVSVE
jgi:hypothetical protein